MLVGLKKRKSRFCLFLFLKNANKKKGWPTFFSGPTKHTFLHNSQYPISDKCRFIVCGPEKMLTTLFYQFFMSVHL